MIRRLCVVFILWCAPALANTYASVEPIATPAVIDTGALQAQPLAIRTQFAQTVSGCGFITDVMDALSATGATTTINDLNTSYAVGAGGFAGATNPSFVFTFLDDGPNAASRHDILVLTNSLGYVMSQSSAFLLDSDDPDAFDFPANYIVVNFAAPPSIEQSASFFEAVGRIDPELFATDTSGYTQYARSYVALQPDVDDEQFLAGYREATQTPGLQYALFRGGAAFPGNDWAAHRNGEEYKARIPSASHGALGTIRERHLNLTRRFQRVVEGGNGATLLMRTLLLKLIAAQCR